MAALPHHPGGGSPGALRLFLGVPLAGRVEKHNTVALRFSLVPVLSEPEQWIQPESERINTGKLSLELLQELRVATLLVQGGVLPILGPRYSGAALGVAVGELEVLDGPPHGLWLAQGTQAIGWPHTLHRELVPHLGLGLDPSQGRSHFAVNKSVRRQTDKSLYGCSSTPPRRWQPRRVGISLYTAALRPEPYPRCVICVFFFFFFFFVFFFFFFFFFFFLFFFFFFFFFLIFFFFFFF